MVRTLGARPQVRDHPENGQSRRRKDSPERIERSFVRFDGVLLFSHGSISRTSENFYRRSAGKSCPTKASPRNCFFDRSGETIPEFEPFVKRAFHRMIPRYLALLNGRTHRTRHQNSPYRPVSPPLLSKLQKLNRIIFHTIINMSLYLLFEQ